MSPAVDSLTLLTLALRLLGAGIFIQSLELLCCWREFPERRLLGWESTRGRLIGPTGRLAWLYRHPASLVVIGLRAGAAAGCLVLPFSSAALPGLLGFLVASQAYYNQRFRLIHQGADTMFLIGLTAVGIASLEPGEPRLRAAALGFLACQVLLAYAASGWDKLKSPAWRNGALMPLIFRDSAHRFAPLAAALVRWKSFAVVTSWSVILLELLFPLCLLLPAPACHAVMLAGIAFHALVAVTMGLHGFFWSFVGAYPGIYFVQAKLAGLHGG